MYLLFAPLQVLLLPRPLSLVCSIVCEHGAQRGARVHNAILSFLLSSSARPFIHSRFRTRRRLRSLCSYYGQLRQAGL